MEALVKLIQKQFDKMCQTGRLFRCDIEGDLLWMAYLEGFGKNDPKWRDPESSVHNCNYCHGFVRRYGNVVAIDQNLEIMSLWDMPLDEVPDEYKASVDGMSQLIHKMGKIKEVFVETFSYLAMDKTPYEINPSNKQETYKLGVEKNIKRYTKEDIDRHPECKLFKVNDTYTYRHMWLSIPRQFISFSNDSREALMAAPRQTKEVFKRGLDEISIDTLQLILDLEAQGSLLNGASYKHVVTKARDYAEKYKNIPAEKKDNFCWLASLEWGPGAAFRNTAIGTFMTDLAEGMEINAACRSFNQKVDPINYMKASAPITKRQIAEAEKFVEENGYTDSLVRRCATIEDIKVSDILHSNQEAGEVKTKVSLFDGLAPTTATRHKKAQFDNVEEVTIDKFMKDILPNCTSVEVYLSNKHRGNFVTLITAENKDSKRIFNWDNNFSWTYAGNLAGKSQIAQAVKAAGGFVDAPFRCSMIWNEDGRADSCDLDLHCTEPNDHIYFGSHNIGKDMNRIDQCQSRSGGVIDIDVTRPGEQCRNNGGVAVENIFWRDLSKVSGKYHFFIHNFNGASNTGVRAEIFFQGQLFSYNYPKRVTSDVHLADVTIKNGEIVDIQHGPYLTNSEEKSEKIYNLDTCEFHKASLICLSPNFWQEHGVGNKHYFFMLAGAECPEDIRTLHNEYLNQDLRNHRKVMEALGAKLKCKSTKNQLSGLGFNATVHDELIVRCKGSFQRVLKIKF